MSFSAIGAAIQTMNSRFKQIPAEKSENCSYLFCEIIQKSIPEGACGSLESRDFWVREKQQEGDEFFYPSYHYHCMLDLLTKIHSQLEFTESSASSESSYSTSSKSTESSASSESSYSTSSKSIQPSASSGLSQATLLREEFVEISPLERIRQLDLRIPVGAHFDYAVKVIYESDVGKLRELLSDPLRLPLSMSEALEILPVALGKDCREMLDLLLENFQGEEKCSLAKTLVEMAGVYNLFELGQDYIQKMKKDPDLSECVIEFSRRMLEKALQEGHLEFFDAAIPQPKVIQIEHLPLAIKLLFKKDRFNEGLGWFRANEKKLPGLHKKLIVFAMQELKNDGLVKELIQGFSFKDDIEFSKKLFMHFYEKEGFSEITRKIALQVGGISALQLDPEVEENFKEALRKQALRQLSSHLPKDFLAELIQGQ